MRNPRVTAILGRITDGRGRPAPLPVRLCTQCLLALPISGVGLALTTADRPGGIVLAATDRRSRQLAELQFSLGEGPCVDASRTGRPVLQGDLAMTGPTRWPRFCKTVIPLNVRAIFAFPLHDGAIRLGVLTLYRENPRRLTSVELSEALAFADAATVVLLHLQNRSHRGNQPSAVTGPIDSRARVHQAAGMITAQLRVSIAEALLRLRAHAYATRRTLIEVAADVIGHRLRFDGAARTPHHDQPRPGDHPT
jgi:GAF domain-containing protein